jgi:hypothetical protein
LIHTNCIKTCSLSLSAQPKKKPVARNSVSLAHQTLVIAKVHLFAYALVEGIYQTWAMFMKWAKVSMSRRNPARRNFGVSGNGFRRFPASQERERERERSENAEFPPVMLRNSRI